MQQNQKAPPAPTTHRALKVDLDIIQINLQSCQSFTRSTFTYVFNPEFEFYCRPSPHLNSSEVRLVHRFQHLHWDRQAHCSLEVGLVDYCSLGHCCLVAVVVRQLGVYLAW